MVEMVPDRFAYFTNLNVSYPGQLTTKPIAIAASCNITVNADASAAGAEVRVELLSSSGYRLRGYDQTAALHIDKSGVSLPALWGVAGGGGRPLKSECSKTVKHCVAPWRTRPCTPTGKECAAVPGVGPVSCGGKPVVCVKGACWSDTYEAPLCVMNATAPGPPPHPPSGELPKAEAEVMVRLEAHFVISLLPVCSTFGLL